MVSIHLIICCVGCKKTFGFLMRLIFFITHLLVTLSNILVLIRIFLFQLLIVDHFWTYSCIEYTSFLYQLFSTDWLILQPLFTPLLKLYTVVVAMQYTDTMNTHWDNLVPRAFREKPWERGWHWEKLHAWENTSRQSPPPPL